MKTIVNGYGEETTFPFLMKQIDCSRIKYDHLLGWGRSFQMFFEQMCWLHFIPRKHYCWLEKPTGQLSGITFCTSLVLLILSFSNETQKAWHRSAYVQCWRLQSCWLLKYSPDTALTFWVKILIWPKANNLQSILFCHFSWCWKGPCRE